MILLLEADPWYHGLRGLPEQCPHIPLQSFGEIVGDVNLEVLENDPRPGRHRVAWDLVVVHILDGRWVVKGPGP